MADDATTPEFLPRHPPRTELEQLTAALDAGLITPAVFALAKAQLERPAAPAPEAPPTPPAPAPAAEPTSEGPAELPPLASFFTEPAPQPAPPAATKAPASAAPAPAPRAVASPEPRPAPPAAKAPVSAPVPPAAAWPTPMAPAPAPVAAPVAAPAYVPTQPTPDFLGRETPLATPPTLPKPAALPPTAPPTSRSVLPKALLVAAILGVLLLVYWQVAGSHPDEQLTSPRHPDTSVAPATATPPPTTKAKHHRRAAKSTKAKSHKAVKTTNATQPVATPTATLSSSAAESDPEEPVAQATATPPEPTPRPVPPVPEAGDSEAATHVRATMAGYYADMLAPPFTAAQHFAPHVERLYIQQNLTRSDIDKSFNQNFFPDNQQALLRIEPGTLRVSDPATDGTRMATFVEDSRVYHPSRQVYQRLRAQVRARFDANYQLVYLRQERLLESAVE